jgi:hypothetical protein
LRGRLWLTLGMGAIAAMVVPGVAGANPAYEPNDGIHQAFGPLATGTNYDATISSNTDDDWYIAYVSGAGVLDLALTNTDDASNSAVFLTLRDQDGKELNSITSSENQTRNLTYTTPGPGHYYAVVESSNPANAYRLQASGPLTSGPRPGAPDEVVPNNNGDKTTAFGPLAGDRLYGGRIDALNEDDWFVFNTAGPGAFEVALTNIDDESNSAVFATLFDQTGEARAQLSDASASENTIDRILYTGGAAAQYFLKIESSNAANSYQFVIRPGSLLTPNTPPAATQACADAQASLEKLKQKLANAKADLASAFTKAAKKKAKRKVKKLKGKVKTAKQVASQACGG